MGMGTSCGSALEYEYEILANGLLGHFSLVGFDLFPRKRSSDLMILPYFPQFFEEVVSPYHVIVGVQLGVVPDP